MVGKAAPVKENNEWSTPQWLFDYFNKLYQFRVDLAADNVNHKCDRYVTESANALTQDWHTYTDEYMWCNPPYGRNLPKWIEKAYEEMHLDAKILMLVPASVGTKYWEEYIINKVPIIYFLIGRVRFVDREGKIRDPPMYDSALIDFNISKRKNNHYTTIFSVNINKIKKN